MEVEGKANKKKNEVMKIEGRLLRKSKGKRKERGGIRGNNGG
jgi:hypothetical protein